MAVENMGRDRDLVLAPGEFAYVLDTTKGLVNVNVGPYKTSMAGTDQPVIWDKSKRRFVRCELEQAIQRDLVAPEGFYMALFNPAKGDPEKSHPRTGTSSNSMELSVGHRVNIPGPATFSLWPGQFADVIRGHHMRSNQYLLAQVYNDVEATANWAQAVVKPQGGETPATPIAPKTFTPGQLMVIKGTDVAFFIPPTGIKVVPDGEAFVREAVTLERLEYCILLDEDGNKRFVQGPAVVFPEPTETFIVKDGTRKFRAIELNETTGIYVKVIADYEEGGRQYKAGEELFITGKEQAIYYQREEHSVIRYGNQTKHYAIAVPAGEGRYVLNRKIGNVKLSRGPEMLLCDPRDEVIVRRVLSQATCALWYPKNNRVLEVNRQLEQAAMLEAGVSQYEAGRAATGTAGPQGPTGVTGAAGPAGPMGYSTAGYGGLNALNALDEEAVKNSRQIMGDTFQRGAGFTPPRTITLDTKYDGAVSLSIWTGYAVLIVNKTGGRRVVVGPENVLLEYDETLAPLELSTGRPKTDNTLFRTVYLRVHNNRVSDSIVVETQDLVKVKLNLAYRVNFEGTDQTKWFEVENYVRLLTDHMRSMIRNIAKRTKIEDFYAHAIDILRDTILGTAVVGADGKSTRPGKLFDENGMRVYDLEVFDTTIEDSVIASLLTTSQTAALKLDIKLADAEKELTVSRRAETIKREDAELKAATAEAVNTSAQKEIAALLAVNVARLNAELEVESTRLARQIESEGKRAKLTTAQIAQEKARDDQRLAVRTQEVEIELRRMLGETEEIVKRTQSIDANLATALTAFSDSALMERMVTTLAPMAAMNGVSAADIMAQLLKGTPFEGVMTQLGARTRMPSLTR